MQSGCGVCFMEANRMQSSFKSKNIAGCAPARLVGGLARLLEMVFWMRPANRTANLGFCWCRMPRPRASGVNATSFPFVYAPRSSCLSLYATERSLQQIYRDEGTLCTSLGHHE